ncbi:Endochitinase-like protein [Hapsidospora chrysogenum ATCC 11550]|uniref:Endochitinase-like protein n=1 Tax=Hapsidospora chrysogenum (strain ATCC 11550 / CBS 779.69 / DSM 880 / IAM 14645 / JCM 23072 / IMI 49137) TaxID=857340 RepID=A0A086SZR3_HAPC1|nr:Endochitinase-like protein [Hapsidospora chrysogenum ATCC 11550]
MDPENNESHDATGVSPWLTPRINFESGPSKTYYLTAAPQCPFPDESPSQDVCEKMDYVWVEFYNNGNCNIVQSGFEESMRT